MSGTGDAASSSTSLHRICARRGCGEQVKKPTARYCSVRCCAVDPERRERIRQQSRRAQARPLAMTRQLTLSLNVGVLDDPEAQLAQVGLSREDVPGGMSRLAG